MQRNSQFNSSRSVRVDSQLTCRKNLSGKAAPPSYPPINPTTLAKSLPKPTDRPSFTIPGHNPSGFTYFSESQTETIEEEARYDDISLLSPAKPQIRISETCIACWDQEVEAIYYYNETTREATWLRPDI